MPATDEAPAGPLFNEPDLDREIRRLRIPDNVTNLGYLALEYLGLAAVIGATIAFCELHAGWGLPWWTCVPVVLLAIVLIGGLQHRLAGLGHEASHYSLVQNKFVNDLLGDLLCMFPVLATLHFYRVFHMAHHQYTNDPVRDPDLHSLGGSKMVDRFPMTRGQFVRSIYLRAIFEPLAVIQFQLDYLALTIIGSAPSVYLERQPGREQTGRAWPRLASILGLAYLVVFIVATWLCSFLKRPDLLPYLGPIGVLVLLVVGNLLPQRAYYPAPFKQPFSPRFAGILRLVYFTAILAALSLLRIRTGGHSTFYFFLLWLVPLGTSFMFYMLLRDVYQHTNADDGRLTNTRVFYPDPFTRWAVFVYGQDMHLPHHLFPAVPHYNLPALHRLLKQRHGDYAAQAVECHGTVISPPGGTSILDTLTHEKAAMPETAGTN